MNDHTPHRFIHDVPPPWDGQQPEAQLEPYVKLLEGWLATTRSQKSQRGMTILHYAGGDLKLIIHELEISELTQDDGGKKVLEYVRSSFAAYVDKKLPRAIENALFVEATAKRKKTESMIQYVARKATLLRELDRVKCVQPPTATGYILMRDAGLSPQAWDTMETWMRGAYEHADVVENLKKLGTPATRPRR